jgi:hypothetical protein
MSNIKTFATANGRSIQVDLDSDATYKQCQAIGRITAGIIPNMAEKPTQAQWDLSYRHTAAFMRYYAEKHGRKPSKGEVQKIFDQKEPKLPAPIAKLVEPPKAKKAKKQAPKASEMDISDLVKALKAQGFDVVKKD